MKSITWSVAAIAALSLAVSGCGKKEEAPTQPTPAPTAATPAADPQTPPTPPPPTADAEASDYVRVLATHSEPKPTDPVVVSFAKWTVTKSAFDPKNLEGGTATLEIDLSSLATDSAKRTKHLQSADYLDVAQFGVATVEIGDVKKATDSSYSATAKVTAHGITVNLPVEFEVVETQADKIRIKGKKDFTRADFKLGKDAEDSVAPALTIEMQLTLSPQA